MQIINKTENPIQASMQKHREDLARVSKKSLSLLEKDLKEPETTVSDRIKIYDTTRKHLNVIDGTGQATNNVNIIIIPGELVNDYSIKGEIIDEKKPNTISTKPKLDS